MSSTAVSNVNDAAVATAVAVLDDDERTNSFPVAEATMVAPSVGGGTSHITLILERRAKQLGMQSGWDVYRNGEFWGRLWAEQTIQMNRMAKGDVVTLVFLNTTHYLTIADDTKSTLRFRAKACGDIGVGMTGFSSIDWIEPCKTRNEDYQCRYLQWTPGPRGKGNNLRAAWTPIAVGVTVGSSEK